MAAAMINWKKGAGNISVVQTPSGEGIGLTGMQLAKYMNFDAFPTSTTINSKGTSITRQSNATKNSKTSFLVKNLVLIMIFIKPKLVRLLMELQLVKVVMNMQLLFSMKLVLLVAILFSLNK